ncbi:universal stress protein [Mycolicibacterium wolinskyi]|uniref:Universal stress protein n=1 Tax=Mycolicibacterium wolinskyi TaxID=59750 RepID=A0A1X2FDJ1_9MYCO|nr:MULTISPECIES: universal stress protein [Mycolicibacterium]MCV7289311.1 universal stress protein [Mycolicibacterium wolinskyi]MCV7294338.1 universal stress protein [Mycolicibacterium goodii]ORX16388.1 universal stress protein [Mycolicibacterium wolinskyi]
MSTAHAVVVGIDGSQSALDAAIWAVKEAVSRDIPLRLIYAIDPTDNGSDHECAARALATAELAIRQAYTAVEATEQPVKIELEVVQDKPIEALFEASRSAAMLCVGATGRDDAARGRIGATAATVAKSAHCPVAVVRTPASGAGGILVEFDGRPSSTTALQAGVDEARLRGAPLCVMTTWQHRYSDMYDASALEDRNRLAQAQLDRRLTRWRRRYPELTVQTVAGDGSALDYLAAHRDSVQLVVVGPEHGRVSELADSDCSLLTCDRQQRL